MPSALRPGTTIAGSGDSKPLPERIEAQEQFMALRLEEIRLVKSAARKLYEMLSEDQKKEADELGIPMAGMMGPRG